MKQINYFLATLAMVIATTFSAYAQYDSQILSEFAKGLELGIKTEMNKSEWKGIMTKAECVYNGDDIVISMEYTYTLQNTTQEYMDMIRGSISSEEMKTVQAQSISSALGANPQVKQLIVDILRRNNCCFVYNIDYIFPTDTQHIDIRLTADDISGKTVTKEDLINLLTQNYTSALKGEIGKNGIVDGKVEYDGSNLVITYVLDYDKDVIDAFPVAEMRDAYISEVKSNPISLSEMRQLNVNNIDIILVYTGVNGGVKTIYIDSDQF